MYIGGGNKRKCAQDGGTWVLVLGLGQLAGLVPWLVYPVIHRLSNSATLSASQGVEL